MTDFNFAQINKYLALKYINENFYTSICSYHLNKTQTEYNYFIKTSQFILYVNWYFFVFFIVPLSSNCDTISDLIITLSWRFDMPQGPQNIFFILFCNAKTQRWIFLVPCILYYERNVFFKYTFWRSIIIVNYIYLVFKKYILSHNCRL